MVCPQVNAQRGELVVDRFVANRERLDLYDADSISHHVGPDK
jgi:hypothetical protein